MEHKPEETIYDSSKRGWPAIDELVQTWRYRYLIVHLVRRDVTARYKRSILGIAWTMINPLGTMLVLTIVFSQVFHSIEGYAAYVLSGLFAWNMFSQTTSSAINSLVWGGELFQKIYVPRSAFAISSIGTGIVNMLFTLVPLFIVMIISNIPIQPTIIFLPISMVLLGCFSLGVGLLISTLGIYFSDVVEMYGIILTAWMYLTPIIYTADALPEVVRKFLVFNPMYHIVALFRIPLYYGQIPSGFQWLLGIVISLGTLFIGWISFTVKSDEYAYRV